MSFSSINPASGELMASLPSWDAHQLESALAAVSAASPEGMATPLAARCQHLDSIAALLRRQRDDLARLITLEMGKLFSESRAEIEKCALACEYYARESAAFLADEIIESDAGFSCVCRQPLGTAGAGTAHSPDTPRRGTRRR